MFRLEIHPSWAAEAIVKIINLGDPDAALHEAKMLIAAELGDPDAFVQLSADGRFMVGAGFRVKSGRYVLQALDGVEKSK